MVWLQSPIFLPLFLFHSQWTIKAMVHLLRTVSVYCFKISHTTPSLFIQSEGDSFSLETNNNDIIIILTLLFVTTGVFSGLGNFFMGLVGGDNLFY